MINSPAIFQRQISSFLPLPPGETSLLKYEANFQFITGARRLRINGERAPFFFISPAHTPAQFCVKSAFFSFPTQKRKKNECIHNPGPKNSGEMEQGPIFSTEMHLIPFIHFVKRCREWKQGNGNFAAVTLFLGMIPAEGDKIGTYGSLSAIILSFFTLAFSPLLCQFFSRPRKCTWKRQLFCHSFIFFLLCGSALYPEYKLHYGLQCPQEVITVLLCPFSDAGNQKSPFVISDWRREMRLLLGGREDVCVCTKAAVYGTHKKSLVYLSPSKQPL